MFADVILPLPLDGAFTYAVPQAMEGSIRVGQRVLVNLGRSKTYVAVVLRLHNNKPQDYQTKPIASLIDSAPIVTEAQLALWQWVSDYYLSPLGEVLVTALPAILKQVDGYRPRTETYVRLSPSFRSPIALHAALNSLSRASKQQHAFITYLQLSGWENMEGDETPAVSEVSREELLNAAQTTLPILSQLVKRGLLETYEVEVSRIGQGGEPHPELVASLSAAQQKAHDELVQLMQTRPINLLHGVTSSGKTEVFIHLIQRELQAGRQVLYLLPEIALTVQMMERLRRVFGHELAIYHSKYSDEERAEIWQRQLSDHPYKIILGARSAVFLPFQQLGLIIVDEEHETSYKQQDRAPRYHARSVAAVLGQLTGAKVILGTATPSAESYYNAMTGKYGLVSLTTRFQDVSLPEIEVVDTGTLQHQRMMQGPFSPQLLSHIRQALWRGEQAIIFQNRRGWAPVVECRQCGWVPRCAKCDVSLTLHKTLGMLSCHYCGSTYHVPERCPACGCEDLRGRGYGTEKIEDLLRDIFPEARIARMDLDTTRTRGAYERIISDFSSCRTNLLIGTQMVSKGLDFAHVSVVGILSADAMLNMPDFRAYEYAFTMMTQVSGRAGRRDRRGHVVLQTRDPSQPVIQQVVSGDYARFYSDLLEERRAFSYPPYTRLVYVYLKHKNERLCEQASEAMALGLRQLFGQRVLGPDRPAVARVKTLSIRKIVIKLERGIDLHAVRTHLRALARQTEQAPQFSAVQVTYDVDPM